MSGDLFWSKFAATASFLEPCEILGRITDLAELRTADGPAPRITLETPDGLTVIVNAVQKRLVSELVRLAPHVGDKIRITYRGTAKRAAPGMNPTKEFTVEVWPKRSQSPGRPSGEASGEVAGENVPETEK